MSDIKKALTDVLMKIYRTTKNKNHPKQYLDYMIIEWKILWIRIRYRKTNRLAKTTITDMEDITEHWTAILSHIWYMTNVWGEILIGNTEWDKEE